ncbi:MAG: PKD domain-containing protein [Dehalococcoidia bacterium]|nr:PKD domain-containing protein [Dehalococcoidia bacterium]
MLRLLRLFVLASTCVGFAICLAIPVSPQPATSHQSIEASERSPGSILSNQVTAAGQCGNLPTCVPSTGTTDAGEQVASDVNSGQPEADFAAVFTTISVGQPVVFTDSSVGDITSWQWDFGDATDAIAWNDSTKPGDGSITHIYASVGTYTVSLTVSGQAGSDTATKTVYVTDSPIQRAQQGMTAEGGTVETPDTQIVAEFPAGALTADATVYVTELPVEAIPAAPDGFKIGSKCIELRAVDVSGQAISVLLQPVTLTIRYSDEDVAIAGGDPNDLLLAYIDRNTNQWTHVDPSVNADDQTLSATASQLGIWAILSENPAAGTAKWVWVVVGIAAGLAAIVLAVLFGRRLARKQHRAQS